MTHTYANNANVSSGLFDFTIRFSRLSPRTVAEPRDLVESEVVAEISMSPQHAKAVMNILAQQLVQYETNWGKIPELPVEPKPKVNH